MDFSTFGFDPQLAANIQAAGYDTATPIQEKAIPVVLAGKDVLGLAQTGTGKTAAFALPILQRLIGGERCVPRALVISPTRELAEQTHQSFETLGKNSGFRSMSIFGGVTVKSQVKAYRTDMPEILVACPGRLLDLMGQRVVDLRTIEILVLDEADQMFDMGFLPSIKQIIAALPRGHQTLLFSATIPAEIRALAKQFQRDPVRVEIGDQKPVETISHFVSHISQADKYDALHSVLGNVDGGQTLVFTRTKHRAKKLALQLTKSGFGATSLQGNLSQGQREKAMASFRSGHAKIMVATDIAARGIDITQISHVINFDIPDTPEAYTHRIGRTGRMQRKGMALTFVTPEDGTVLRSIEKHLGGPIERMTVEYTPGLSPESGSQEMGGPKSGTTSGRAALDPDLVAMSGRRPAGTQPASASRAAPHRQERSSGTPSGSGSARGASALPSRNGTSSRGEPSRSAGPARGVSASGSRSRTPSRGAAASRSSANSRSSDRGFGFRTRSAGTSR